MPDPVIRLALIVAVAENGVIGRDNTLPWHLPGDLQYFKRVTMGKPIIMGRKTFDSIGRPLPGRTNIVISRDRAYRAEGAAVVSSLDAALEVARDAGGGAANAEVVVIGGAEIYRLALPLASRLYITEVHAAVEGDAWMPDIAWDQWREISREPHAAAGENPYDFSFVVHERQPS